MSAILLMAVNARFLHSSWSLRCLQAALGDLEPECRILEFVLKTPRAEALAAVRAQAPAILGISVYIWNHGWVLDFLAALAGLDWPAGRPLVVLGGPQAGQLPLEFAGLAHVVVQGEGEVVFGCLAREYLAHPADWCRRQGLAVPDSRQGPDCPARPLVLAGVPADPATLAGPCQLYSDDDLHHQRLVYVESSRGCPFACSFCQSSLETGVRQVPEAAFLPAMQELIDRGARRFKLLDRTFNANIPRAVRILRFFLEHLPDQAFVHVELVPQVLPPELREVIAAFPPGRLRLEIGIQTFNPLSARLVNRVQDVPAELANLAWLRDHSQALVHADLIAGLPGEDLASFARGFDRLWELAPGEIQLGLLKLLPGTPLAGLGREWGMVYDEQPPYQVRSTSALSAGEIISLERFARYWELVVNRGHFDACLPALLPPGCSAFDRFAGFVRDSWAHFGRGHAIDRAVLRDWIAGWCAAHPA